MTEKIDPETGLVTVEAQGAGMTLFGSDDPAAVMERMKGVATVLAGVIEDRKLFMEIKDKKTGKVKRHVYIEGWTLLGSLLGVMPRTVSCDPVLGADGHLLGFKAEVEVLRGGKLTGGAIAFCMKSETRGPWAYADDYALASMAQTRAASKALRMPLGFVMQLAGYDVLPADEVPPGGFPEPVHAPVQGTQGSAPPPASTPKPAPPAPAKDAQGRPTLKGGETYHACPSCKSETVRVNPADGNAYCWIKAGGCGGKWLASIWSKVSVPFDETPPPMQSQFADAKEADAVLDLTGDDGDSLPF